MADCMICDAISEKIPCLKVYEDDKAFAFLSERPASSGHVIVVPKMHFPILEAVPDYISGHLFNVANKISMAMFDAFGAQGTNIIIQNGLAAGQDTAHFMIHVIARGSDDGLNFSWNPRQLSEEQMSSIELSVIKETKSIGAFEKEKPKPIDLDRMARAAPEKEGSTDAPQPKIPPEKNIPEGDEKSEEDEAFPNNHAKANVKETEENYLVKQLNRMP